MNEPEVAWLREQFERCKPWIQAALDTDIGTHGIGDVWHAIERGHAQLWPLANSVIVTVIETYPQAKALRWWLVGGELNELLAHEPVIAGWAKRNGCNLALCGGRRGWVKTLPGYTEAHTVMAKKI